MEEQAKIAELMKTLIMLSIGDDTDSASLDAARSALAAASGQDFGSSIDDWMAWYEKSVGPPPAVLQISHSMYNTRLGIRRIEQRKKGANED